MPSYLTPTRYRSMGTGVTLTSVTDGELASHIAHASALVNAYCSVPPGHDFRGGSVIGEAHVWDVGSLKRSPSNRVWPFHAPLKTATALRIEVTNNQTISFTEDESLYVHPTEGWIEPVTLALTTFGVFGYGILPNIGLRQPVAKIDYTYGYDFAAEETLVTASGTTLLADNQFFTDENIVLKKNGTIMTTGFTVDRTEGTITLDTPTTPGEEYTLAYHYKMPSAIATATSMLVTQMLGAAAIATAGLTGLTSIKVEEVSLSQSKAGFLYTGMSGPATLLLAPYVVRTMA